MIWVLWACSQRDTSGDTGEVKLTADPHGLDGCGYAVRYQGSLTDEDCEGSYDADGRALGESCVSDAGDPNHYLITYDATGCLVGVDWYFDFDADIGGDWWNVETYTCDAQLNETGGSSHQVEHSEDGALIDEYDRSWTVTNTYDDGLLTAAATLYDDGETKDESWTYDERGWVDEYTWIFDGGASNIRTYTYDDDGHVTRVTSRQGRSSPVEQEYLYEYDALGRQTTYEWRDAESGRLEWASTLAYDGVTIRFVTEDEDTDGDGTVDQWSTWRWDCE